MDTSARSCPVPTNQWCNSLYPDTTAISCCQPNSFNFQARLRLASRRSVFPGASAPPFIGSFFSHSRYVVRLEELIYSSRSADS
jgi:hypothetical protein